jgi:hypothetical protein
MTTAETLKTSQRLAVSFWLLTPKWLRRLTRHCEECGGTTFERDESPSAPPWSTESRVRQINLLTAQSTLDGFRNGAVRR